MGIRLKLGSPQSKHIYSQWQVANRNFYARIYLLFSLGSMLLLALFDFAVFGDKAMPLLLARVFASFVIVGGFLLLRAASASGKLTGNQEWQRWILDILLSIPVAAWTVLYAVLLFKVEMQKFEIYYLGFLLILTLSSFLLHRYFRAALFYMVSSLILLTIFGIGKKHFFDQILTADTFLVVCFLLFSMLRIEFRNNLHNRHSLFASVLPVKIAETLALSFDQSQNVDLFVPQNRYVCCICADWRGFHSLTEKKSAQEISFMLERFYDEVLLSLQKTAPSGLFFLNWTADELFIIFYDDKNRSDRVFAEASAFAEDLVQTIFKKVNQEFHNEIMYDVGLSAGYGLLGLLGPKTLKKTTVAGEVAGLAKRYQEEAKHLRTRLVSRLSPILVVDQGVLERSEFLKHFPREEFKATVSNVKNISGKTCYAWTMDFARRGESKKAAS